MAEDLKAEITAKVVFETGKFSRDMKKVAKEATDPLTVGLKEAFNVLKAQLPYNIRRMLISIKEILSKGLGGGATSSFPTFTLAGKQLKHIGKAAEAAGFGLPPGAPPGREDETNRNLRDIKDNLITMLAFIRNIVFGIGGILGILAAIAAADKLMSNTIRLLLKVFVLLVRPITLVIVFFLRAFIVASMKGTKLLSGLWKFIAGILKNTAKFLENLASGRLQKDLKSVFDAFADIFWDAVVDVLYPGKTKEEKERIKLTLKDIFKNALDLFLAGLIIKPLNINLDDIITGIKNKIEEIKLDDIVNNIITGIKNKIEEIKLDDIVDEIKNKASQLKLDEIIDEIKNKLGAINIDEISNAIKEKITSIDLSKINIAEIITNLMSAFVNFVDSIPGLKGLRETIQNIINTLRDSFAKVLNDIWDFLTKSLIPALSDFLSGITKLVDDGIKTATDFVSKLLSGISDLVDKGIKPFKEAIDNIGKAISDFFDKIKKFEIKVPEIDVSGAPIIGDFFKKKDVVITKRGDILSLSPEDFIIATKSPEKLAGAGGSSVSIGNIIVNVRTDANPNEIAEAIERVLRDKIKARGYTYGGGSGVI
jgi:hypothetical protein